MKTGTPIQNYESFYFKAIITPREPNSGFCLSFGATGQDGSLTTGVSFSGRSGFVFDQSGNFFGGYYSGRSLNLEGHFFGDRLSYFYNSKLVNNNIPIANNFNAVEFEKFGDSTLSLEVNYISGLRSDEGLQDINGNFLISRDNFYILPTL